MSHVGRNRHNDCAEGTLAQRIEVQGRRSLALLRSIEDTLSALDLDCNHLTAIAREMDNLTQRITAHPPAHEELDPDGKCAELFDQALESLASLRRRYEAKLAAAEADQALCEADGIVEAYRCAIEATEDAFEATQHAAEAVREHDAEASGYTEVFSDVDALFGELMR